MAVGKGRLNPKGELIAMNTKVRRLKSSCSSPQNASKS